MKRIAVLVSGSGSNLQALIDACGSGDITGHIVLVLSNRANVFALERAANAGIPAKVFALRPWLANGGTRDSYDAAVAELVVEARPDLVVLAGWMHVLGPAFLDRSPAKVINLHPALPGQFPGTCAIERALESFNEGKISHTGCMVHEVIPEVDAGPVLGTAEVPIEAGDTAETLAARMHTVEHRLLVGVVARLSRT